METHSEVDVTATEKPVLSVFGLGYVGCVSAACLASRGHRVIGVDVNPAKTAALREGRAPVVEERIGELTAEVVASGLLTVSDDPAGAVHASAITIVCVGTPSTSGGGLSTAYLERVSNAIGEALASKEGWHVVSYRSTMLPGTCENLLVPILERASGKRAGKDFGVCVNPEFLREGSSVRDFLDPPKTVVGQSDDRSGSEVMNIFDGLGGPRFHAPIPIAEMTKFVDNSFHALKVTFGNEIGSLCAALGLDSYALMEIFLSDSKLNISPAYLRPAFAFGGSCLPKDVRALNYLARRHDVEVPVLANILPSNEKLIRHAIDLVISLGRRRVGIFGLAFKSGTDDLRESPMVELAEQLIGKGYSVRVYDSQVAVSRLIGANRACIEDRLPHLEKVLTDNVDEVLDHCEVFIAGSTDAAVASAADRVGDECAIVDLVRLPGAEERRQEKFYFGIGW
ncbi:nucleotide sugar dehydrogenase [Rhodococcus phenolicus]|uniref:nucleotide sugar dehydrogenase n=1 Tax=Rhodococcus phenolicus TaxID=263849 RepID=UPI00316ACBD8